VGVLVVHEDRDAALLQLVAEVLMQPGVTARSSRTSGRPDRSCGSRASSPPVGRRVAERRAAALGDQQPVQVGRQLWRPAEGEVESLLAESAHLGGSAQSHRDDGHRGQLGGERRDGTSNAACWSSLDPRAVVEPLDVQYGTAEKPDLDLGGISAVVDVKEMPLSDGGGNATTGDRQEAQPFSSISPVQPFG
jgi:hypothetical protein